MNIPDIPPSQLIPWLRKQAKEMTDLADRMEQVFGATSQPVVSPAIRVRTPRTVIQEPPALSESALADSIREHGGRVNHVAARLGVPEEQIYALIEQSEGRIYAADRGWLKVKD